MSIGFSGPKGWVEQRWIVYAMLRDNVQHYLEGGEPTGEFEALHSIAEVLGGKKLSVPARRLHEELVRAKATLACRPLSDLAISLRTRSVLSFKWPPPERAETILVSEWGGSVPMLNDTVRSMDDVFGHFVDALLQITEGASASDVVEVADL